MSKTVILVCAAIISAIILSVLGFRAGYDGAIEKGWGCSINVEQIPNPVCDYECTRSCFGKTSYDDCLAKCCYWPHLETR